MNTTINVNTRTIHYNLDFALNQFKKKRVAVYARVSRDGELKHQSIEAQTENLKAHIMKHPDWEFADYYVDEGVTGTKLNRPEFNRMLSDARAGKIDIILTKSVSRMGRNTSALCKILQELKELDVAVIFDNENISTADPETMFYLQYLAIQAEAEAKQASDYQKWAIRTRYKEGIPNHFRPYGYIMKDHQLHIIPEEAEVVKRIFKMYLSGMGKQAICKSLNKDGISTHNGVKWQQSTIHDMLRNKVYTGDLLLQKFYVCDFLTKREVRNHGELPQYLVWDAHEAIIDRDTFKKVQNEIALRQKKHTGTNHSDKKTPRLLSGLVRCGHCGGSIYYKYNHGDTNRKTWVCKQHVATGADYCPVKPIREDILVSATKEVLLEDNLIKEDTVLTNTLLKTHIKQIIANENYELIYQLYNGHTVTKSCKCPSRSKSWTPEMRQKARERALAQHAKRKEEKAHA